MGFWMTVFAVWVGVMFACLSVGLLMVVFLFTPTKSDEKKRSPEDGDREDERTKSWGS